MSQPSLTQLFEESCDPHGYIPRRASEEVLRCLSSLVRDGVPAVVLHGPAGIGKSMLLRVLHERFEDERRVAYVSVGETPEPELCHRILDQLAEPAADDPAQALVRAAGRASGGHPRLLLLIDHANLAPIASSLQLVEAAQAAAPHLTVIFAVADDAGAEEFARALAAQARVSTLCFNQSMDSQEATAYVRLRLARTQIPAELRERLDSRALDWLSEGAQAALPREINRLASELLQSYEENGEAVLSNPPDVSQPPDVSSPDSDHQPRAIDPSEIPRDAPVEVDPPTFPMSPGDPPAAGGGGSLGGMLLGHGPGAKPDFGMDLELGRSLSSGLLESASPKKSKKDGQPVLAPAAGGEASGVDQAGRAAPDTGSSRQRLAAAMAATFVLAIVIVGVYAVSSGPSGDEQPAATEASTPASDAGTPTGTQASASGELAANPTTPSNQLAAPHQPTARPTIASGPLLESAMAALERAAESQPEKPTIAKLAATPKPRPAPVRPTPAAPRPSRRQTASTAPLVLNARPGATDANTAASYVLLSIDVEPGSRVQVDGQPIGVAPFSEIFVEMGTHTFVAEMPDGVRVEQLVDVQVGTDIVEF